MCWAFFDLAAWNTGVCATVHHQGTAIETGKCSGGCRSGQTRTCGKALKGDLFSEKRVRISHSHSPSEDDPWKISRRAHRASWKNCAACHHSPIRRLARWSTLRVVATFAVPRRRVPDAAQVVHYAIGRLTTYYLLLTIYYLLLTTYYVLLSTV